MRNIVRALVFTLAVAQAPGCYKIHYYSPEGQAQGKGASHSTMVNTFFWGLWSPSEVSLDQCGSAGFYKMESRIGLIGLIATGLTGGIWMPYTVKVVCAQPKGSEAPVEEDLSGFAMARVPATAPEALVWAE